MARLGRGPRFGAWNAAYDAHYVYTYFHKASGFAVIPLVWPARQRPPVSPRWRSTLCGQTAQPRLTSPPPPRLLHSVRAGYPYHTCSPTRTVSLLFQTSARHAATTCLFPGRRESAVPTLTPLREVWLHHHARHRHRAPAFITLWTGKARATSRCTPRTTVERVNSQTEGMGMLRRGRAITNHNTLTSMLITFRLLHACTTPQWRGGQLTAKWVPPAA